MSGPVPPLSISRKTARFTLWVCLWGMFVANFTLTVVTVALPSIARDLQADPAHTNWVTLGPMLVVALFTSAAGRAADTYGRKRLWVLGFGLTLAGIAGSAAAPSLGPLIIARVVTGLGNALLVPAALAISTSLYPPEERATPVGYWTSTVAISPLIGVIAGGYLLDVMSWRWLFATQLALGLPPFVAAALGFVEQRFEVHGRFDWEGSAAIALAALAAMLSATWVGTHGLISAHVLGALACTAAACAWAVSAERRAQNPVIPPALLADAAVTMSLMSRVALNFTYMGAFMTLPYFLQNIWKLTPGEVSFLLVWRPLAMGIAGPFAGRLVAAFGAGKPVVWGALSILFATAAFVALGETQNHALVIAGLAVAGVGLGLSAPASVAVVAARTGAELLGTVSGLMTLAATISNVLGMAVLFAAVEAGGGVFRVHAYRASFSLGTLIALGGTVASLRLLRILDREARARGTI